MNLVTLDDARKLVAGGADLEMVLLFLRENGFDKIDSINALRGFYEISFSNAKELVDHSDTWSDRFHSDAAFHEQLERVMREMVRAKDPDLPNITLEQQEE